MNQRELTTGVRPWRLLLRLLGGAACIVALVAALAIGRPPRTDARLAIQPESILLDDRLYREGEVVRGTYRLVNLSPRPVLIKGYSTSCTCTASESRQGEAPPFTLRPGQSSEFVIKTDLRATHEPVRTFQAFVEAECDGEPLPHLAATMRVRVEDLLLPYPPQVSAVAIPAGRPSRQAVLLATRNAATTVTRPRIVTSDPSWIVADLAEPAPGELQGSGLAARYRLDITLTPREGAAPRSGKVSLLFDDRPTVEIPIECSVKSPYQLSSDRITLRGRAGAEAVGKVFYQYSDRDSESPRVLSTPEGVDAKIEDFDPNTKLVRVSTRIPAQGSRAMPRGEVAIRIGAGGSVVKIPVTCEVAGP